MIKMFRNYFSILKFNSKKNEFYFLLFFSVLSAVFSIIPIFALEHIVNTALLKNEKELFLIIGLGLLYLLMQVIFAFAQAVSSYLSERIQKSICSELQKKIYSKLCIVDYVKLRNSDTLKFTNSIIEDTNNISENYMAPVSQAIMALISFVLALAYMLNVDIILTFLLFPLVVLTAISSRSIQQKLSKIVSIKREENENLWKLFSELIKGISSIRLLNRQKYFESKVSESVISSKQSGIDQAKLESTNIFVMTVLFMFTIGGILIITSIFLVEGKISMGSLVAILMYNHMLVDPLINFVDVQANINKVYISISKLNSILSLSDYYVDVFSETKPTRLEVKDVEYQYPNQEEKFYYNFSLNLAKKYAIVGASGIGKSTIAKILCGLNQLDAGEIKYYDENNSEVVSPKIAYHEQDGYIFDQSIKENILFGNESINEATYQLILDTCCLNELATSYEDSSLGENGSRISGGERKRILIARTLSYTDASVFIFDEICASLDSSTIRKILDKLIKNYANKAFIFIDHNPIINDYVDNVIAVEQRRIVYEEDY